ncbi:2-oxo-4-hydroxy-4-carboxy-5-ureidoimidazoline decarboxylase [Kribbella sp. CA-293567]|uniref:2-oxo-4-hydroxy-4-carboxy-5-ureidoimidazoline decarboxylase n=1 Tax=Kribbella sp. CA-293567 TaxID=3002436 RepID=UPI0022DDB48A|nr:2-oxo-4-hydroxy-4-carboxy-5-ureidoimidazoline decarboxylase [Kribbella sp. CA-293567]WBQ07965.1 2-oxo-4-hydroxy-4-carboxy-5-ureidoimidazoline decarboxylase [Kribbella sp. CA-293567]
MNLDSFNTAPPDRLRPVLAACCDVPRWVDTVLTSRPYADVDALLKVADEAARALTTDEVTQALAAHPRIGDRPQGDTTEANWSRTEQSAVGNDPSVRTALAEGNQAYEARFGQVFLICATGLTAPQILTTLTRRLTNTPTAEAAEVHEELRKIALLRLTKALPETQVPA